jgi:hypothetical protein
MRVALSLGEFSLGGREKATFMPEGKSDFVVSARPSLR